jgi:integrase/recombinase XerD
MTDQAISPLGRRMIEDTSIRKFTSGTQHNYVRFVKEFSIFFGRSPDKAAFEDVRRYQLHLASRGVSPFTINAAVTALRFFFKVTLRRHDIADHIPFVSQPQKLPVPVGYSNPDVPMVKTTQDWQGEYASYPLGVARNRRVLLQR